MPSKLRLDHLDMLRGFAAFLVLAEHVRAYTFQSYAELSQAGVQTGVFVKAFYFSTGLGHQAVIIFFALSGFLVGGKAFSEILNRRFIWSRYIARRLTRLWIVIIPILILTLLLDTIGLKLTSGEGCDGSYYNIYFFCPNTLIENNHSLLIFFGNLAFLQTIYVPIFGSNVPMWSLANEFWYYIVFPLATWLGLARISVISRTLGIFILLFLLIALPRWLLEVGVIWVAGAVAAWCTQRQAFANFTRSTFMRLGAATLLISALILSRAPTIELGDLALGLAVALVLPVLANLPSLGGTYATLARASSEISYTLYLTHFPFLTLIVVTGFAPVRLPPSMAVAGLYTALILSAIIWAAVLWWCFERNTDRVYSWIAGKLPVYRISTSEK